MAKLDYGQLNLKMELVDQLVDVFFGRFAQLGMRFDRGFNAVRQDVHCHSPFPEAVAEVVAFFELRRDGPGAVFFPFVHQKGRSAFTGD